MIPETIKNFNVRKNALEFTLNDKTKKTCASVDVPNAPVFVKCNHVQKLTPPQVTLQCKKEKNNRTENISNISYTVEKLKKL